MLAAMMAGASLQRSANLHPSGSFTVPSGVTTVYITAVGTGGGAGPNTVSGGTYGGGGGGGGSAAINVPVTVTSGDVIDLFLQLTGFLVRLNSSTLGTINYGGSPSGADYRGGQGASVTWGSTTASGGAGGGTISPGANGSNGQVVVLSGGGTLIGGGGGGGGNTVSPAADGGDGGSTGQFPGTNNVSYWGGGGGGVSQGQTRLSASTVSSTGGSYVYVYY